MLRLASYIIRMKEHRNPKMALHGKLMGGGGPRDCPKIKIKGGVTESGQELEIRS